MINGVHAILFSKEAEQVRAFFRDKLGFSSVDAGDGWLIFALPPAELGVHPADADAPAQLYLLCDDVETTVEELGAQGVTFSGPITEEAWGRLTWILLPDGAKLGLYEPKHPTTIGLPA
jgi:predicted enzyme related to lactoylglutathione lyase